MLSALMEGNAESSGSPERAGLVLTQALTGAVAFEWDLEGLEGVEKAVRKFSSSQESRCQEAASLSMFAFLKARWLQTRS